MLTALLGRRFNITAKLTTLPQIDGKADSSLVPRYINRPAG